MVSAGRYPGKAIDDNLDLAFFGLGDDPLEALVATEHVVGNVAACDCKWVCVGFLELVLVHSLIEYGVVVPLEDAHEVQGGDSSAAVLLDGFLDFGEVSALDKFPAVLGVDLCALIVHIDFVEDLVPHTFGVNNDPALGLRAELVILSLIVRGVLLLDDVLVVCIDLGDHLKGLKSAGLLDSDDTPVVETAFPELSKVYRDLRLVVLGTHYVPLVDLVPRQDGLVHTLNGRWCTQTDEQLRIFLLT